MYIHPYLHTYPSGSEGISDKVLKERWYDSVRISSEPIKCKF